jgi:hypothetical protein
MNFDDIEIAHVCRIPNEYQHVINVFSILDFVKVLFVSQTRYPKVMRLRKYSTRILLCQLQKLQFRKKNCIYVSI